MIELGILLLVCGISTASNVASIAGVYCALHTNGKRTLNDHRLSCWGRGGPWLPMNSNRSVGEPFHRNLVGTTSVVHSTDTLLPTAGLDAYSGPLDDGDEEHGIAKIVAGGSFFCALYTDRKSLRCFGDNTDGQLGRPFNGRNEQLALADIPNVNLGGKEILDLAAGAAHVCVVLAPVEIGNVVCWGRNNDFQLGYASTDDDGLKPDDDNVEVDVTYSRYTPNPDTTVFNATTTAANTTAPATMTAAATTAAATTAAATTAAAPTTVATTTASATTTMTTAPTSSTPPTSTATASRQMMRKRQATSAATTAAGSTATLNTTWYPIGRTTAHRFEPVLRSDGNVPLSVAAVRISAGRSHTCIISDALVPYCWGNNRQKQLGLKLARALSVPASQAHKVDFEYAAVDILAASESTCVLLVSGDVQCWGSDTFGQLGYRVDFQGNPASNYVDLLFDELPNKVPVAVPNTIDKGTGFMCSLPKTPLALNCWGSASAFVKRADDGTVQDVNNVQSSDALSSSFTLQLPAADISNQRRIIDFNIDSASMSVTLDNGELRLFGFNEQGTNLGGDKPLGYSMTIDETPVDFGSFTVDLATPLLEGIPCPATDDFGGDCTCSEEPPAPAVCVNGEVLLKTPLGKEEAIVLHSGDVVKIHDGQYFDGNITLYINGTRNTAKQPPRLQKRSFDEKPDATSVKCFNDRFFRSYIKIRADFSDIDQGKSVEIARGCFVLSGSEIPTKLEVVPVDEPQDVCYVYTATFDESKVSTGFFVTLAKEDCLPVALIVGICVGVFCFILCLALILFFVVRRLREKETMMSTRRTTTTAADVEMQSAIFDRKEKENPNSQYGPVDFANSTKRKHKKANEANYGFAPVPAKDQYDLAPVVRDSGIRDDVNGGEYADMPLHSSANNEYERTDMPLGDDTTSRTSSSTNTSNDGMANYGKAPPQQYQNVPPQRVEQQGDYDRIDMNDNNYEKADSAFTAGRDTLAESFQYSKAPPPRHSRIVEH